MEKYKLDRIGSCERGENPTLLMKMKSGFAVIGDSQFLPGYCVLLAYPKISSLNDLPLKERQQFLLDMSVLGDAIIKTCHPLRLNYSLMSNLDHYLHAHIFARYDDEPDEYKNKPAWEYPKEQFFSREYRFDIVKHKELKDSLTENLIILTKRIYKSAV